MKYLSAALFFSIFIFISAPIFAAEKIYNAESFTLPNGLQVIHIPNHRAPVIAHMLWYKVGSADEPQGDGVSGEAHFLEHLMFKGTKAVEAGEFSKLIRKIGGEDNAFTSWDFTAYFQTIPSAHLKTIMALEADRMMNLNPPETDIASEHKVIIEERKQTVDNDPRALFWEQMRASLYNTSTYSIPIIGWKNEMPKISWDLAQSYYQKWYAPNNAILVVSGDVKLDDLKKWAEKFYGVIPPKKIPDHIRATVPEFPAVQKLYFKDKSVQQPLVVRARLAPSAAQDYQTALAFAVIEEILSSNPSSYLYQEFVVKQKNAIEVSLSYEGDNRGQGSLWVYAVPASSISLQELEKKVIEYLENSAAKGFSAKDIAEAKQRLTDSALYARDSVMGPAMMIGRGLSSGLTLEQIETWPAEISKLSDDKINSVFKEYLSAQNQSWITGYMEEEKK